VPLRHDTAQPAGKLAAPVEIVEQRIFADGPRAVKAIKLTVDRIGKLPRTRFSARANDGPCRSLQDGAILSDELLLGWLRTMPECASQRQIFEVKRLQIGFCDFRRRLPRGKAVYYAAVQCCCKFLVSNVPTGGVRAHVERFQKRGVCGARIQESVDESFWRHRGYDRSRTIL
jgi:hypothetical protein